MSLNPFGYSIVDLNQLIIIPTKNRYLKTLSSGSGPTILSSYLQELFTIPEPTISLIDSVSNVKTFFRHCPNFSLLDLIYSNCDL